MGKEYTKDATEHGQIAIANAIRGLYQSDSSNKKEYIEFNRDATEYGQKIIVDAIKGLGKLNGNSSQNTDFGYTLNLPTTRNQRIDVLDDGSLVFIKSEDDPSHYSLVVKQPLWVIPEQSNAQPPLADYAEGVLSCQDEEVKITQNSHQNSICGRDGIYGVNSYSLYFPLGKNINLSISPAQKVTLCNFTIKKYDGRIVTPLINSRVFFPNGLIINGYSYNQNIPNISGSNDSTSQQVKNSIYIQGFNLNDNDSYFYTKFFCWKDGIENQIRGDKYIEFLIDGDSVFNIYDYIHFNNIEITGFEFFDSSNGQAVTGEHTVCIRNAFTGEIYARETINGNTLDKTILLPTYIVTNGDLNLNVLEFYCENDDTYKGGSDSGIYGWSVETSDGLSAPKTQTPGTFYKEVHGNSDPVYTCKIRVALSRK